MGQFDDAAEDAAKKTDKELEGDFDKLSVLSEGEIKSLFPSEIDQVAINTLISQVQKTTDKNQIKTALKAFAAVASVEAFKMAKKLILSLAVCLLPLSVAAENSWQSLGDFIGDKAAETKIVYGASWPGGIAQHMGGAYVPIHTFHSKAAKKEDQVDYLDWGIGVEDVEGSVKPRAIIPIMFNLPAISRRLWNGQWRKDHVRTTSLPPIWFGPMLRVPTSLSREGF